MGAGQADQGPIAVLTDILLRAHPPSLSDIVLLLEDVELVSEFHQLVEEFLEGKPWVPPEQMELPLEFKEGSHEDRAEVGAP